jgi:hypothetical protein
VYTNVNLSAPVGALSFLGVGFLIFVAAVALAYSVVKRKFGLARVAVAAMAGISAVYLGVLLVFSFSSSDKLVARGEEKYFCEIDCHLAYSITDVRETKTLGEGANAVTAGGMFRVIAIKTRFDENTITPTRGNAPLRPNSRVLTLITEDGQEYLPSPAGQAALPSQIAGTPITNPLRPGENYTTAVVFDVPGDVKNPTLLIQEGHFLTLLIIGHENSLFHKKTRFQL